MAEKLILRGKVWYYRLTLANGRRVMQKGCTDKRETERMRDAAAIEQAKVRSGLVDPKELAYRDHQARPLAAHIADWSGTLAAKGATPKHIDLSTGRVRRLVAVIRGANLSDIDPPKNVKRKDLPRYEERLADWLAPARLSDLTAELVQQALSTLRAKGRSLATLNHYRTAAKAFSRWCHETRRTREDALRGVKGYNAKEDRRHDRRTISLAELQELIKVAERGPVVMGVTGPARGLCYRLAVATGLRYSEIASIKPTSFDWKAPSVRVAAAYTKNGMEAELPLPGDLVADLRPFVEALPAEAFVWPLPKDKGAELLQADLAVAEIPYQDESGLFFDFHSLRCQTATLADAAGVSPRVVQKLMRPSTLELTGRYTRPRAVDIEAAASLLPSLKSVGDGSEGMALTGTDGGSDPRHRSRGTGPADQTLQENAVEGSSDRNPLAPSLLHPGSVSCRELADTGEMKGRAHPSSMGRKSLVGKDVAANCRLQSAAVGSTGEATRTPDLRIMRSRLHRRQPIHAGDFASSALDIRGEHQPPYSSPLSHQRAP